MTTRSPIAVRLRTSLAPIAAAVLALTGHIVSARQAPATAVDTNATTAPLTTKIPTDPAITIGTLPNGLKYYVRRNVKPAGRAELRLVVNAGSLMEEDDQRGLAHFVEHMAFNGTKHFPKQDVVTFMESAGMRFGPHVNAYTSFDETVYMLQVPVDKPAVTEKAMQILEDWAGGVAFDDKEIDAERGVVMEEWRLGRGADARIQDKQFPILLQDSRYADRLPIGKPEIIQGVNHDRLRKFYADWYRPDLMAVLAIGDFDQAAMEAAIKTHFTRVPKAATPLTRPSYPVPDHAGTRYTIVTDKEQPNATVTVYNISPVRDQSTIAAYRQQLLVEALYTGMLTDRLQDIAQRPDSPFLGAFAARGLFVRSAEAANLSALANDGAVEASLDALFTETERVAQFGFTPAEFDRQKKDMIAQMDNAVTEAGTRESRSYADEYIRNYLQGEPIPGIAYEHALYDRFMPGITLAEVNGLAAGWSPDRNRIVAVTGPDRPGLSMPDPSKLAAVMANASKKVLSAHVDNTISLPLLEGTPKAGAIASTVSSPYGITEWVLSNGVRVVLKPTPFKEDEIVFRAFSPGGTSLATDADFVAASTAAQVIGNGGLGNFSMTELQKQLAGRTAGASPFFSDTESGLSGGSSRKDVEAMFQLIYMTFMQPRADPTLFGVMTSRTKTQLESAAATPDYQFEVALAAALSNNHLRARVPTPAWVDEMNLGKSLAFYRDRFADASNFTFVFVGSLTPELIKPLAETYLASLPATHRAETWKDNGPTPPRGVVVRRVEKGIEPKSQTAIVFGGPFEWSPANRVAIRAMGEILERRLRESLREELGSTYSVSVNAGYNKIPKPTYTLGIEFGFAPEKADTLIKRVFDEIDKLQKAGPTAKEVDDAREGLLRDFETNSQQNGYLLTNLAVRYEYKEDVKEFFSIPDLYKKLTPAIIQTAAKTWADQKNYVNVTLFPEKK